MQENLAGAEKCMDGDDRGEPPRRRRRRRRLNMEATVAKYAARMRALPTSHFEPLRDGYLSTFDVWGTFDTEGTATQNTTSSAFELANICIEKGVHVRGITSERKAGGEYICTYLLNGDVRHECNVQYVGMFNYFTQSPATPWSIIREDKVYVE